MKAKALNTLFDARGDVAKFLDLARARRTSQTPRCVNAEPRAPGTRLAPGGDRCDHQ